MNSEDAYDTPWIRTRYGKFNLANPTFDVRDIAHGLGMIARFNGHTRKFFSVAAHSMLVAMLMHRHVGGDPIEGLLHDATEAYLSDVPSPFKRHLPDWQAVDARVESALRAHFGLTPSKTAYCKDADWLALFIEAKQLLPGEGADFADPLNLRPRALELIRHDDALVIIPPGDEEYEPCSPEADARGWISLYELLTLRARKAPPNADVKAAL